MIEYNELIKNASDVQNEYIKLCNGINIESICGHNIRFIRILRRNGFTDSLTLVKWLLYNDVNRDYKFFNIPSLGPVAYEVMIPMLEKHCNIVFPEYIKKDYYKHNRWCSLQKKYKFNKEEMLYEVSLYNKNRN